MLQEYEFAKGANHQCLSVDAKHVAMYDGEWQREGGEWVDDGLILQRKFKAGYGIRALNYCIGKKERIRSL